MLVPMAIVFVMAVAVVDVVRVIAALHRLVTAGAVMPVLVASVFLVLVHV
jgi:hypothetical protein